MNAFAANHHPQVYPDQFESRPERFLDGNDNVVPPEHPAKRRSASNFQNMKFAHMPRFEELI